MAGSIHWKSRVNDAVFFDSAEVASSDELVTAVLVDVIATARLSVCKPCTG
jgi:hypothetical protein